MILDLRDLEEFPAHVTLTAADGEIAPVRDDVRSVGAVTMALTVQKSGDEFYCQGTVSSLVLLECARCLGPLQFDARGSTDFIATTEQLRQQYRAEAVDGEEYVVFDGNDLQADVTGIVRETLLLELPMKPLCDDACKGLCSRCGANLNDKTCDCDKEAIDPRWEGLKVLLDRSPEKGKK